MAENNPVITERRREILEAVDNLIDVHDRWEADPQRPLFPTDEFAPCIADAALYCDPTRGHIPSECFNVCTAMIDLMAKWEDYLEGASNEDGNPTRMFWDGFRSLVQAREGSVARPPKRIETPTLLREQKVSDNQIAKIWGTRNAKGIFFGPFYDEAGGVRSDLIQNEVDKPGSILGENPVPISERIREQEEKDASMRRMDAVARRLSHDGLNPRYEPAEVEGLLREGQYLEIIAKVAQWSVSEVSDYAESLGIVTINQVNLQAERGTYDPELTVEQDAALQPKDAESIPLTPEEQAIVDYHTEHPDASPSAIGKAFNCSHQKVGIVLAKYRRTQEAAAATT